MSADLTDRDCELLAALATCQERNYGIAGAIRYLLTHCHMTRAESKRLLSLVVEALREEVKP